MPYSLHICRNILSPSKKLGISREILLCSLKWVFPKMVVPPNHPFLIGFSIINHPFWGIPIFGNTQIVEIFVPQSRQRFQASMRRRSPSSAPLRPSPTVWPAPRSGDMPSWGGHGGADSRDKDRCTPKSVLPWYLAGVL